MIGIVDYGMGNLGSVSNAFSYLGLRADVLDSPDQFLNHDRLLLPGVGSFRVAMDRLDTTGWSALLRSKGASGLPILGICLGMQLLFDEGQEDGPRAGLGLIPGRVVSLNRDTGLRVPQIGWNSLIYERTHPLFSSIKQHVDFYFVHSFHCIPQFTTDIVASCKYGDDIVASVARGNIAGVQFHPEKSQDCGLKLLSNFSHW